MSSTGRSAVLGIMLISGVVFFVVAGIAASYIQQQGFEPQLLAPLLPPAFAVVLLIVMMRTRMASGLSRSALSGLTFGCCLYLLVPVLFLSTRYHLIERDGTAFWALLIIPAMWLWPAVLLAGAVLGVGTHHLKRAVNKRRSGDA